MRVEALGFNSDQDTSLAHSYLTTFNDTTFDVAVCRSPFFENVQCVRETEILVEQQPPQGVFVCGHAGLVINELSHLLNNVEPGRAYFPGLICDHIPSGI